MSAAFHDALSPFRGHASIGPNPPADFILRSSDGMNFHVHVDILKFGSSCFDDMFTAARDGGNEPEEGKPVSTLPEPHAVLRLLLTLAYPPVSVSQYTLDVSGLDVFVATYKAAQEYRLVHVQELLSQMLNNPALIETQPYRLFAIARICSEPRVVRQAALCALRSPLKRAPDTFPEMELMTRGNANKLAEFHRLCGLNAERIVSVSAMEPRGAFSVDYPDETLDLFDLQYQNTETTDVYVWWARAGKHGRRCGPREPKRQDGTPDEYKFRAAPLRWFHDHMEGVAAKGLVVPDHDLVKAEILSIPPSIRAIIDSCSLCSRCAYGDLANFAEHLGMDIENSNNLLVKPLCKSLP
ncbi:hypothetical protein B0H12DRAFT_1145746 [Mycena haematopus]|nr:hypothetical protein B0H12DRAFT_1145746 [Mycena haematopus]